jgi:hypothetical protein
VEWAKHLQDRKHSAEEDGLAQLKYNLTRREHNSLWGGFERVLSLSLSLSLSGQSEEVLFLIRFWGNQIVWDPQSPLLGTQRDRRLTEEVQACVF